jgi:hypothetical protein
VIPFPGYAPVHPMMRNNPNPPMPEEMICPKLAHAYVPDQPYAGFFPLDVALKKGTIFQSLYGVYPVPKSEMD